MSVQICLKRTVISSDMMLSAVKTTADSNTDCVWRLERVTGNWSIGFKVHMVMENLEKSWNFEKYFQGLESHGK